MKQKLKRYRIFYRYDFNMAQPAEKKGGGKSTKHNSILGNTNTGTSSLLGGVDN